MHVRAHTHVKEQTELAASEAQAHDDSLPGTVLDVAPYEDNLTVVAVKFEDSGGGHPFEAGHESILKDLVTNGVPGLDVATPTLPDHASSAGTMDDASEIKAADSEKEEILDHRRARESD
eukprot:3479715-Rhodomonas_salina.1